MHELQPKLVFKIGFRGTYLYTHNKEPQGRVVVIIQAFTLLGKLPDPRSNAAPSGCELGVEPLPHKPVDIVSCTQHGPEPEPIFLGAGGFG